MQKSFYNRTYWLHHDTEDDVVSMGFKNLRFSHSISILMWLLSFILIMIQVIQHNTFSQSNVVLFIPMWLGSGLGVMAAVLVCRKVCGNATLVTRERRLFMRAQGVENDLEFIDYDSLPLMRRLFCLDVVSVIFFLVALVSQVLFYLWFVDTIVSIWDALLPSGLMGCVYLVYLYLMNVFSWQICLAVALTAVQLGLYLLKSNDELPRFCSWTVVSLPAVLLQLLGIAHLLSIARHSCSRRFILSRTQWCCLCGFLVAFSTSLAAVILLAVEDRQLLPQRQQTITGPTSKTVAVLWMVAITFGTVCAVVIANVEARRVAHSRGFTPPLPLTRTQEGWEVATGGCPWHSGLLGVVRTRRPSSLLQHSMNGVYGAVAQSGWGVVPPVTGLAVASNSWEEQGTFAPETISAKNPHSDIFPVM